MSANVTTRSQPVHLSSPPLIGAITQPVNEVPTGSVVLNGLPASGAWTLKLIPGNVISSGNEESPQRFQVLHREFITFL